MRDRYRYLVALVVTGHVGTEIDGLRRALSSKDVERIAAHITIVPPTNVASEQAGEAIDLLRRTASFMSPISVTLGPPTTFGDRDDVVFLGVHGDLAALRELHTALNTGVFAPPPSREPRAFLPHVTIGGNFRGDRAWSACTALSGYAADYTFGSLALLEQDTTDAAHPWSVVAEFDFVPDSIVGRGGRELVFSMSRELDPLAREFLEDEWAKYAIASYGPPAPMNDTFGLVARQDGEIVGVVGGFIVGTTWRVDRLIVADTHRGQGIGSQILRQLESHCREREGSRLRLVTRSEGPARALYEAHGYVVTAELANWRETETFVMMERALRAI